MTEYRMRLHELIVLYKQIYGNNLDYLRIWQHSDLTCQQCSSNHIMIKLDEQLDDLADLLEEEVRSYSFTVEEHVLNVNLTINIYEFELIMQQFPSPNSDKYRPDFRKTIRAAMKKYKLSGTDMGVALGQNPVYARQNFFRRLHNDAFSRQELCKLVEVLHIPVTDILGAK